ncbi:MAG TPA: MFS transporter, partial [Jatrophihabitans sp.]|nr:MFS transporter [Jatrophihabitans sp.]
MTTQTLAPEAGRRSDRTAWSPDRRALTAGLLLTVGTGAFEALGVGTVMPAANAELHDLHHYGLVFSAFMLTQLLGVVAGGRLADSTSPQRPFVGGTLLFAGGLLVTGTAGSMLAMALGRGLQGLGAGAVSGLAMYAVRRCYAAPARPRMLALLSTAYTVPGLVGPSIAAAVAGTVGWRWVFLGL